jgi:uncharacterized protein with LGFP repeats
VTTHRDAPGPAPSPAPVHGAGEELALRTPAPEPIRPVLHTIAIPAAGPARTPVLPARRTQRFSLIGVTWADPHLRLAASLQIRTRSTDSGGWSPWATLPTADDPLDDTTTSPARTRSLRGGTAPIWVDDSDGVQLQLGQTLMTRPPAGLRLDLIDPGRPGTPRAPGNDSNDTRTEHVAPAGYVLAGPTSGTSPGSGPYPRTGSAPATGPTTTVESATNAPSGVTPPTSGTSTSGSITSTPSTLTPSTLTPSTLTPSTLTPSTLTPSTSTSSTPNPSLPASAPTERTPNIVARAGWQADESLRPAAPQYASSVKVVFVHHTTTTNNYSCSQSPAIVRGMYAYHVLSLGWNDIGYNFLVDKCGTVFEGRYGGTTRPVIGAQTYGFNTNSTGIAVIGTHTSTAASPAAVAAVAHLAAWKLAIDGVNPNGRSTLVESASDSHGFVAGRTYTFNAISGHRDGYATACPGNALYAQLPALRALASQNTQTNPVVVLSPRSGANTVAGRYYTQGQVTMGWSSNETTSLLLGHTVLVDGRVTAATDAATSSAPLTLPAGSHTVTVKATYRATIANGPETGGNTYTRTATATVVSDTTAPTFTAGPTVRLRAGTVNKTGTPVSLTWRTTDNTVLARVRASTPTQATFAPTTTTWSTVAGPGTRTFTLTAVDGAGNTRTATATSNATLLPETAASRSGKWATTKSTGYLDGTALTSATAGARLGWHFTGRSVAWIASRIPTAGQAVIYLDGRNAGTINLKATSTAHRQAVWVRNGLTPTRHTLTIVVVGTASRPTVTTDGILYLR